MKKLGFGCMRLPMIGNEVDLPQTSQMIDAYLEAGFNYFDTAHGYINGLSEKAIGAALSARYPRERFILTNKLSGGFFSCREDIEPLLDQQLAICGVSYFDYYLMHGLGKGSYPKYVQCDAFNEVARLKEKGKVRHIGMSFHDSPECLEKILTEQPLIEVVQLQLNYRDWEDPGVQSRACYEVCQKHGKPVLVMEPIRGGSLVDLPQPALDVLNGLNGGSVASYALRYAASLDGVMMVLSGMSSIAQMEDNIATMRDFQPLNDTERAAIAQVVDILRNQNQIPCTGCRYCTERCPMNIAIPRLFSMVNTKREFPHTNTERAFRESTRNNARPSECLKCGACEEACPQHIEIRKLLEEIALEYEK